MRVPEHRVKRWRRVVVLAGACLVAMAGFRTDAGAADLDPLFDPAPMTPAPAYFFSPQPTGYEIRGGVFAHSPAFQEAGSADVNLELMTPRIGAPVPGWLQFLMPRLQVGGFLNTAGKTSYVYGGAVWTVDITPKIFFEPMFGAAVHNGELNTVDPTRVSLGCPLLFHVGASAGYRVTNNWMLVATWDHISNANFCPRNVGLNTYGLKIGYSF